LFGGPLLIRNPNQNHCTFAFNKWQPELLRPSQRQRVCSLIGSAAVEDGITPLASLHKPAALEPINRASPFFMPLAPLMPTGTQQLDVRFSPDLLVLGTLTVQLLINVHGPLLLTRF